jgi:hypothetical protein
MPTVAERSAPYANFMLNPRPGPGVCRRCFTFTGGYALCIPCRDTPQLLQAVAPISYSVDGEQLHHALAGYKRQTGTSAQRFELHLSAVLWRFLASHEACVAAAAEVDGFDRVCTVPSGDAARDEHHPLRRIVGEIVLPTRDRHARLLSRTAKPVAARAFDRDKYRVAQRIDDAAVLLIDDTWTTGASAQSAAGALLDAGAAVVAAVVIGRHIHRDFQDNDQRLGQLPRPFDWGLCPLEP